jgi:hypothetical protein
MDSKFWLLNAHFLKLKSFISNDNHIAVLFHSFSAVLVCLPCLGSQQGSCNQMGA